MFDAGKTRVIGLPYGKKNCDDMLSHFHMIPERNGQTDGRTDIFAISISGVCMLTRDEIDHWSYWRVSHSLRGSASIVLTATGQVDVRWRILTPPPQNRNP